MPGLVDIHFHGCVGHDFCDGTEESIQALADYELSCGVTSITPATMTLDEETLTRVCLAAAAHKNNRGPAHWNQYGRAFYFQGKERSAKRGICPQAGCPYV